MNKYININKLKKHFKKGITPLLCALTVFNLCCINSHALTYTFDYQFNVVSSGYKLSSNSNYTFANFHSSGLMGLSSGLYDVILGSTFPTLGYAGQSQLICTMGLSSNFSLTSTSSVKANFYFNDGTAIYSKKADYISKFISNPNFYGGIYFACTWSSLDLSNLYKIDLYIDDIQFSPSNNFDDFIIVPVSFQGTIISDSQVSDINNTLNSTPNGSINDVSQSEINSVDSKEEALVGTDVSTSDLNVSINPQASSVVWNLVDNAVTGNAKVFAMFISILTIGIIGLILNR